MDQDFGADRYEIVVVDDGSVDDTTRVVSEASTATDDPRVRLIAQSPRNQHAARNRGIRHAEASVIAFFDDDLLAPRTWLSSMVDGVGRHPEAVCLGGPARLRPEDRLPRVCGRCAPAPEDGSFDRGSEERPVANVAGGNMIVRRESFDAVGPFDESLTGYGSETEWMMRLFQAGETIVYLPSAWVWHRRGPDQLRLTNRVRKAFEVGRGDARFQARSGDAWARAARSFGMSPVGRRRIAWVPRLLGHAVRRGCTGGLTHASAALGYGFEDVRLRWAR
jgi:GT2 family glycosyltransferase